MKFTRVISMLLAVVMTLSAVADSSAITAFSADVDEPGEVTAAPEDVAETTSVTEGSAMPETSEPAVTAVSEDDDGAATLPSSELSADSLPATEAPAGTVTETDAALPELGKNFTEITEPAEDIYFCGMPEHTHGEACYNPLGELICGVEEHMHTELCYAPEQFGIMTMSVVHEESSPDGCDFILSLNGSGGYTLTFNGTRVPTNSELKSMLKIDGINYAGSVNVIVVNDSVRELGISAFYNFPGLIAVDFQGVNPYITELPQNCFANCPALTSVDIENLISLETIGDSFCGNTAIKTLTIPSKVSSFSENAFSNSDNLETVYFEENTVLTNAPKFYKMKGLKNINLENLKADTVYIYFDKTSSHMFSDCISLETLYIPSNFSSIMDSATTYKNVDSLCSGCSSLRELIFAPNPNIKALANTTNGTAIESLDLSPLYELEYFDEEKSPVKHLIFDSDLETSGGVHLEGCSSLETIEFKKDVLSDKTAYGAFDGCSSLRSVDLEKFVNLKTIETDSFNGCSSISELTIPSTVTKINSNAFGNMTSLRNLTLKANIAECSKNIFNNVNGMTLTVADTVTTLNRDFLIAANGHTSDIIFPANAVLTLPAGDPVGGIFGDGTGEQIYYTDGAGNLYLLENGGLSLVHAVKSLAEITVPENVGGLPVTSVASYAFEEGAAQSVTFENPGNVSLSDFAFTGAHQLASVNGKTEAGAIKALFANSSAIPDAAFLETNITFADRKNPADDLTESAESNSTEAKYGTNVNGIKASTDKTDLLTGETGSVTINASNYEWERYRIYVMADDPRWFTAPKLTATDKEQYTIEGPTQVPGENIWYFDFIPVRDGSTINTAITVTTKNYPTPSGTSAYVWGAALSKDNPGDAAVYYPNRDVNVYGDGVYVSPEYIKFVWTTEHKEFTLSKERLKNDVAYPLGFQKSSTDGLIALKPVAYKLGLISSTGSSVGSETEYGADYVKTVEFKDTFKLPEGLKWRDNIAADSVTKNVTGNSASVYAKIDGKEYLVAQVSGFGGVAGNITDIRLEKTGNELSVVWDVENSSLSGTPSEISINSSSAMISFGGDIIIQDTAVPAPAEGYAVKNHIDSTVNFTHGDRSELHADSAEDRVKAGEGELKMSKTLVGGKPTRMNEPVTYNIRIWNESAYDAGMWNIWDWLTDENSYLEPEEIERLFFEEDYGKYLEITVTDAYFLNSGETIPTEQFTAVDGETVGTPSYLDSTVNTLDDYTVYDKDAVDPVTGQTKNTEKRYKRFNGTKKTVTYTFDTENKQIKLSYDGITKKIGVGGDYTTVAEAMKDLKMYVGNSTKYMLKWYTLDKGIIYAPGDEVNIRVNARIKDSFMMLDGKVVEGGNSEMDVDHHYRAGWNSEATHEWATNIWYGQSGQDFKAENIAALKDKEEHDKVYQPVEAFYIKNDLDIIKDAIIDGTEYGTQDGGNERITEKLRLDMDMDYVLRLKHWGTGTYDTLPVVDHMNGLQVVLAPADLNKGAEWIPHTSLHYVDGRAYYALNLNGVSGRYIYKGVQFDKYYADRIEVAETKEGDVRTGFDTLLYFYFVDTLPLEYEQVIQYKITTNREICLGKDAGSLEKWSLNNAVWVNDVPGRRITENLIHDGTLLKFEKKISLERGGVPALDKVADSSAITEEKNTVLYRMHLYNNSRTETVNLSGSQIYDLLPQTYGQFTWSTDNVSLEWVEDSPNLEITYGGDEVEIKDGKMYVNDVLNEPWHITSSGTSADIRYKIEFENDLHFRFAPQQSIYFYVTLTFPTGEDWDKYHSDVTGGDGEDKAVENSLFVYGMEDRVEHTLVNPGKALLQKGVYEIGTYNVANPADRTFYDYYIGHDRTHYSYNTEGTLEQQKIQLNTVTYYIFIENTGEGKLYLTDVYDVLPEGFEFLSLRGSAGRKWSAEAWYMSHFPGYSVGGLGTPNSTISASEGGLDYLVAWATEDTEYQKKDYSKFRNATIKATTNGNTVTFSFSSPSTGTHAKDMDHDDNGVYLNEGEYTQIVFTAVTGSKEDLANAAYAENSAFMEYYVPGLSDANVEVDTESGVTVSTRNNLSANDGDRKLWSKEEAESTGVTDLKTHNDDPVFLASSVNVIPGEIIPGIQKTLNEGEAATREYNDDTDSIKWKLTLFNDGDAAMPFDFEDAIQYPLRFKGKMTYELYAGSRGIYTDNKDDINGRLLNATADKNKGKDYLFDFTEWGSDNSEGEFAIIKTHSTSSEINEYKLYVNGSLYKKAGADWTQVSSHCVKLNLATVFNDAKSETASYFGQSTFTYFVPVYLAKNADGDLTLRVEFSKACIDENGSRPMPYSLAIPAGGHVDMTVLSEMQKGLDTKAASGIFYNTARVLPVDGFDAGYVTHGSDFDREGVKGVESSATVNVHTGFPTSSYQEIFEKGNEEHNSGISTDPQNNKIFLNNKDSVFTYRLIFDNLNPDEGKVLNELVLVDPLPYIRDTLALSSSSERHSEFPVNFADTLGIKVYYYDVDEKGAEVSGSRHDIPNSSYTVEYSTSYDRDELDNDGLHGTDTYDRWDDKFDPESDRSIRIIINGTDAKTYLNTGEENHTRRIIVEFDAVVNPTAAPGQIAWNNFGYRYKYTDSSGGGTGGTEHELTSQPSIVGIQFPSAPTIEKVVTDDSDKPYELSEEKTFKFIIYKNNDRVNITDFTESGIHDALVGEGITDVTVATVTVGKGKSSGTYLLENAMVAEWNDDKYEAGADEFTWETNLSNIKDYHVVEIADDPDTAFAGFGNADDAQFDFIYNQEADVTIKAVNSVKTWQAAIVKTDADTGAGLSGAEFEIYTLRESKDGEPVTYDGKSLYLYDTVTTNADGTVTITGLTEGEYYIKEITAPKGYKIDNIGFVKISRGADGVVVTAKFADTKQPEPSKLGNLEILKTMNVSPSEAFDFTITLKFPSKGVDTVEKDGTVYIAKQYDESESFKKDPLTVSWKVETDSAFNTFASLPKIRNIRAPRLLSGDSGTITDIKPGDTWKETVKLKVGYKISFTDLPDGTIYTVKENLSANQQKNIKPKDESKTGAISVNSKKTLKVDYENVMISQVSFKKTISPAEGDNPEKTFDFIVTIKDNSGKELSGEYPYTVKTGGADITGKVRSGGVISGIKHGYTVTINELPIGAQVYIGEFKPADGYIDITVGNDKLTEYPASGGTYYGRTVNVTEDGASLEFVNTVPEGKLKIEKKVRGAESFENAVFRFRIELKNSAGTPVSGTFDTAKSEKVTFDKKGIGYVNIKPGESVTVSGLPVGASYTVAEQGGTVNGAEINSLTYGSFAENGTGKITADGDSPATATVTNFISPEFSLTKRAVGASLSDESFDVTVTIQKLPKWVKGSVTAVARVYTSGEIQSGPSINLNAAVGETFTKTLRSGDKLVIYGLPTGTELSVKEKDGDYVGILVSHGGTAEYISGDKVLGEYELYNYPTGKLTLSKKVEGITDDAAGDFEFKITFTPPTNPDSGNADVDAYLKALTNIAETVSVDIDKKNVTAEGNVLTVKVKAGGSVTVSGLPAGTGYEITEDTTDYDVTFGEAPGAEKGTVSGGAAVEVTATNTLKTGKLTVAKVIDGDGRDETDQFEFTVVFSSPEGVTLANEYDVTVPANIVTWGHNTSGALTATFKLRGGENATFTGLPYGTSYTVAENGVDASGYINGYKSEISGSTGTVSTGSSSVTAANTRGVGSLKISKKILNPYDGDPAAFSVKLTLTDADGERITKPLTYTGSGGQISSEADGTYLLNIAPNEAVTISGIPNGAVYKIEEINAGNYEPKYENPSGNIIENLEAEATVANTRKTGTLEISKKVEPAASANATDLFTFKLSFKIGTKNLEGDYNYAVEKSGSSKQNMSVILKDGEGRIQLHADEKAVFELPFGTEYTVTEEDFDNYSQSCPSSTGTVEAGQTSTVAYTNTVLKPDYAISKVLGAGDTGKLIFVKPGESVTYTVTVTGTGDEGSVSENISFEDKIPTWLNADKTEITPADKGVTENKDETETGFVKYSWTIPRLKSGETVKVKITATVDKNIAESKVWKNAVTTPGKPDEPSDEIESDPGKLSVTKKYVDLLGKTVDDKTEFKFTLKLTLPEESKATLRGSYPYKVGNEEREMTADNSGTYTFTLSPGETAEITNLPTGADYVITENIPTGAKYEKGKVTGDSGKIGVNAKAAQFENIYTPEPVKDEIGFTKNLTGDPELRDGNYTFSFKAELTDATKAAAVEYDKTAEVSFTTKLGETSVTKDGKFGFTFKAAGTYEFRISEDTSANLPAVHYGSNSYTVKFAVEDNNGALETVGDPEIKKSGNESVQKIVFDNTFDPKVASVILNAKKTLSGPIPKDKTYDFTFTVTQTKAAGRNIPEENRKSGSVSVTGLGASKTGDSITVLNEKYVEEGEYVYEIREIPGNGDHIKYDGSVYTVTVTVTAASDGTLEDEVAITKDGKAFTENMPEFENKYVPTPVKASAKASKTVEGRDWKAADNGVYGFILKPADPDIQDKNGKKGILPTGVDKLTAKAVTNSGGTGGDVNFEDIGFTEPGNYYYSLYEDGIPENIHGISKDQNSIAVIFIVTDDEGALRASVKYGDKNSAGFVNKFTPGTAIIGGNKAISGRAWTSSDSGKYEFTLTPKNGAPMPAASNAEPVIAKAVTASDGKSGMFTFPAISYEKAGTYEYEIKETGGAADRLSPDKNAAKVRVVVDEALHAEVTYSYANGVYSEDKPTFTNVYTPEPVEAKIEALKTISGGRKWDDKIDSGRYEFTLTPDSKDFPMPEGSVDGVYTVKAGDGGKIAFPKMSFGKTGKFGYTVAEKKYDANGVKSTSATHKATVDVTDDNNDGVLEISVEYVGEPVFENVYTPVGTEYAVTVGKKLYKDGEEIPLTGYDFSFTMTEADNPGGGMILPENKTAKASEPLRTARFGNIAFTKAGSYSVTVKEDDNGGKVIYDQRTLTVRFDVVEDPAKGELSVTSVYEFDDTTDDPTFENELAPSVPHVTIDKTQQVSGGDITKEKLEVKPGDEVTYYLTVTSDGETTSRDVVITDKIPDGLSLIADSISDGGSLGSDGVTITWKIGDLDVGKSTTVHFTVTVPQVSEHTEWINGASTHYSNNPDNPDEPGEPEKDIPSNEVEIEEFVPHISIEKEQSVGEGSRTKEKLEVKPGDEVTYYLTVTSDGEEDSVAVDVTVKDEIPAGLELVEDSISDGGTMADGIITWQLGDMAKGASKTVSFKVTVPEAGKSWKNMATASHRPPEDPDNPEDTPSNEVEIEKKFGSLTLRKTVGGNAGDTVGDFEFRIDLTGPDGKPLAESYRYSGSISGELKSGDTVAIGHGETVTIEDIPTGTRYRITETDSRGHTVKSSGDVGEIAADYESLADFVNVRNVYQPGVPDGRLTVWKTVGDGGDKAREFSFTVRFFDARGREISGSFSYSGSHSGSIPNGGSVLLKDGESVTICGIPAGTSYTVSETPTEDYISMPTGDSGTVSAGGEEVASFVNLPVETVDHPFEPARTDELFDDVDVSGGQNGFSAVFIPILTLISAAALTVLLERKRR